MRSRTGLFAEDAEPAVKSPRRMGTDGELDITPMIDVTFLLLIFFMVCSTMEGDNDVDVPVAQYGTGVETRKATIIVVTAATAGGSPTITLENGQRTDFAGVRRHVAEHVAGNRRQVIIKAERLVPHGFVQQVARAVNEVEGAQFYVGVHEK